MKLQLVDERGEVITVPHLGPLEVDFVETVVRAVLGYGVGVFRTEAQVEQAIRRGLRDAVSALKRDSRYVVKR